MEREFLEAKLNDTLKAMEELQTLVNKAREEAQKRAASAQSAVQDCKNEACNVVLGRAAKMESGKQGWKEGGLSIYGKTIN